MPVSHKKSTVADSEGMLNFSDCGVTLTYMKVLHLVRFWVFSTVLLSTSKQINKERKHDGGKCLGMRHPGYGPGHDSK